MLNNDTITSIKTFGTIAGAEMVGQLPTQSEVETTVKVIIQLGMFAIWYLDRKARKENDKEDNKQSR